ncbi:MAG: hypothetical protein HYX55_06215 [Chloroflexi bacterium]|nr:hypothetical protein [Chloroflexota bacterium]
MEVRTHERLVTLVWIDAREARIVRWADESAHVERLESDVPSHRQSSGQVRHDPRVRPGGGGGSAATSGEPRRLEHLARFLEAVADRVPDGDLQLIGPGTVHEHLARVVRDADPRGIRHIETAASAPLTDRQLIARLRRLVGHEPRRRTIARRRRLA